MKNATTPSAKTLYNILEKMTINTKGYIYFALKTEDENLDLEFFEKFLSIKPTKFEKMFSRGKIPVCTIWKYSTGNLINPDYHKEIENLIEKLSKHKLEFLKIKNENPEISFILEIVLQLGDEHPCLNISNKTISFMNDIGGMIDFEIYNEK